MRTPLFSAGNPYNAIPPMYNVQQPPQYGGVRQQQSYRPVAGYQQQVTHPLPQAHGGSGEKSQLFAE